MLSKDFCYYEMEEKKSYLIEGNGTMNVPLVGTKRGLRKGHRVSDRIPVITGRGAHISMLERGIERPCLVLC